VSLELESALSAITDALNVAEATLVKRVGPLREVRRPVEGVGTFIVRARAGIIVERPDGVEVRLILGGSVRERRAACHVIGELADMIERGRAEMLVELAADEAALTVAMGRLVLGEP
jgi:hypothetical protein